MILPTYFIHFAFLFFALTGLSGVWMRLTPFFDITSIPYSNILHAHSHIAILGWAFLGVFIILLALLWPSMKQKKQGIILTSVIFIISLMMFGAFIYEGYGTFSIIMSTLHIFVEYWAIIFIYQQLKKQDQLSKISTLFIKGALISLAISTIGPFSLGFLGATGLRDSAFFEMAIYFYLHFQYNGWLFLVLIGSFCMLLQRLQIPLQIKRLQYGFWIYFIALFPWYLSSILWVENVSNNAAVVAAIGSIGQWIGTIYIILSFSNIWRTIRTSIHRLTTFCLVIVFGLLIFKSAMELGLIFPKLATLVYHTRAVIIGYLHFTLLGFVSLFILTQFTFIKIINPNNYLSLIGILLFLLGFIVNEFILFMSGLTTWLNIAHLSFSLEGLLIASILLVFGIGILWYASIISYKKRAFYHR